MLELGSDRWAASTDFESEPLRERRALKVVSEKQLSPVASNC